jgi:hypothetical protein
MADPQRTRPQVPRDEKGRILKGHSLNPGGSIKGLSARVRDLCERAQEEGDDATIWEWYDRVRRGKVPGFGARERMEAAQRLEVRAYGRPAETQIQIQAELTDVDGAADVAAEALLSLAGDSSPLEADPDPVGGSIGGIESLTAETH